MTPSAQVSGQSTNIYKTVHDNKKSGNLMQTTGVQHQFMISPPKMVT